MNNIGNCTDTVHGVKSRKALNSIGKENCNNIPSFNIFTVKVTCNRLNVLHKSFAANKVTEAFGNVVHTKILGAFAKELEAVPVFGFNHKNDSFRNNVSLHT